MLPRPGCRFIFITGPSVASSGDREFGHAPAQCREARCARSTNTHPVASRGGAASLSQMPVAHGGSTHCRGSFRLRALDPAVHQMRPHSPGAGKRRPDEVRCRGLGRRQSGAADVRSHIAKQETSPANRNQNACGGCASRGCICPAMFSGFAEQDVG